MPPLAVAAEAVVILALAGFLAVGAMGVGLWRVMGAGPRRNRAYKRSRELLAKGDWQGAKLAVQEIREIGFQTPDWAGRINNVEGECLRRSGDDALEAGKYEEALDLYLSSAKLLGLPRDEASAKVVDGMLGELRRLVAEREDEHGIRQAQRILQVRPTCAEASFWLGLMAIRLNRGEQATMNLRAALESIENKSIEPMLYLGMHLVREGKTKDGLRYLGEANKAANSVVTSWQLGMGLAMGGGDTGFAIRALQKALAQDGLPKLARNADAFWQQAFPDDSYIGRLTKEHTFVCPLLGANVAGMIRQARMALGQTLYRADRFVEAASVFQDAMNDGEPTVAMLRALGIALCRLERFDEAYPHLRAAYEQESTKNPLTACYLAFAAAKAKPTRPEDKPANVRWAVRLLVDLSYPVELEPARLVAGVYAEARTVDAPVSVEDHLRLCNTVVALNAAEAFAAQAVDHLAAAMPDALRPPFALLYGWAARQHGVRGERDLELLARIFQNPSAAEAYYRERGWELAEVERLFLERWSENRGGFPDVFGPDYPPRCEQTLLAQAQTLEAAGKIDAARATIDLLRKLIPANTASFDQLAKLAWHRDEFDEAARILNQWAEQSPGDSQPRLRLAVLEQERGHGLIASEHLRAAFDKSTGTARAQIAYLGARLALKGDRFAEAIDWLSVCLSHDGNHSEALWLQAAIKWRTGNRSALASMTAATDAVNSDDPRFRYLAGVCQLMAAQNTSARQTVESLLNWPEWQADALHLLGIIENADRDWTAAATHLAEAAKTSEGPLADHARALLGRVRIEQADYVDAVRWWMAVPSEKRNEWRLTEALGGWAYLAGVQALTTGNEPAACEWLGAARDLGSKDPRLGVLHERAAIAAVRRLVEQGSFANLDPFLPALERASKSRGSLQLPAAVLLARIHRQRGGLPEAREVLRRLASPPPLPALVELGLIAIADQQFSQADEVFARVLQEQPNQSAVRYNLFWSRLSQGLPDAAQALIPELIRDAQTTEERRLLTHLQILMGGGAGATPLLADMTAEEEQRLIAALFAVSRLNVTVPWLCLLGGARSHSPTAREAQTMGMIRLGKQFFDRGDWLHCEKWLGPLAKARPLAAIRNLLGCCMCLQQDFAGGILHLQEALRLAGDDPRLHQNLALAFTWQDDVGEAELCWGRYLGTADHRMPRPPGYIEYHDHLRFHTLRYLGNQAYEREEWGQALSYLSEAQQFHPENVELTERLFLLQIQSGEKSQARKTLAHLQSLRPRHTPYELYELDLIEVRNAADLERLLDTLAQVVERLIEDPTSQEKAVARVMPQLQSRADQLTRVLRDIREDLQRLPEESNAWFDALRDLRAIKKDLRRLRQIVRYCAQLQIADAHRRRLDTLTDELDRKIDYCRRWEELD